MLKENIKTGPKPGESGGEGGNSRGPGGGREVRYGYWNSELGK